MSWLVSLFEAPSNPLSLQQLILVLSTPPLYPGRPPLPILSIPTINSPPPAQVYAPPHDNSLDHLAPNRAMLTDLLTHTAVIPREWVDPLPAIYQESQTLYHPSKAAHYAQSYHMHDDNQDYALPPMAHHTQPELITGTLSITRCAISSFSHSSIDLQSPSLSHSRATSSVILPTGITLIIR